MPSPTRRSSCVILALAILALAAAHAPAAAQNLPPGSYGSTCIDARLLDGNLVATCRLADQSMRQTVLANPFACPAGVANLNGHLACAPAGPALPAGSYPNSCDNIQMVDGNLLADCRRADQTMRRTALADAAQCGGPIENIDGRLVCRAASMSMAAPRGSLWGAIAARDGRNDEGGVVDSAGTASGGTRRQAEDAALAQCGGEQRGCEIKLSFQGGCGAYATSRKHAGTGTGYSQRDAENQALEQCRKHSCRIALQYCVPGGS